MSVGVATHRDRSTRAAAAICVAVLLALLVAGIAEARSAPLLYHGSRRQHVVALTFDDAYSPYYVRGILAILKRQHVKATFFPVSVAVAESPGLWRRVLREGHAIGNHTVDHVALTRLSAPSLRRQLTLSFRQIRNAIGQADPGYFRPPYGLLDRNVLRQASRSGFRAVVKWDVDARDWEGLTRRQMIRNATVGTNGSIVVMHVLPSTVAILPTVIRNYRQRGFEFVTIPQLLDRFTRRPKPAAVSAPRGRPLLACDALLSPITMWSGGLAARATPCAERAHGAGGSGRVPAPWSAPEVAQAPAVESGVSYAGRVRARPV